MNLLLFLKIDSTFNDNDEKIEYNLVLKLHQGQGYLDSKNNDPMIYRRIEKHEEQGQWFYEDRVFARHWRDAPMSDHRSAEQI